MRGRRWCVSLLWIVVVGFLLVNFSAVYLHKSSLMSFIENAQKVARKGGNELVVKRVEIDGFLGWKPVFFLQGVELTSSDASDTTTIDFGDISVSENIFDKRIVVMLKNDIRLSYPSSDDKCCTVVNFVGKRPEIEFLFSVSLDTLLKSINIDDEEGKFSALKHMEKFSYQDNGFELNVRKRDDEFKKALESQGCSIQFNASGNTSVVEMKLGKSRYYPEGSSGLYPDVFAKLGDITFDMKAKKVLNSVEDGEADFIEISPMNFNSDLFYVNSHSSISRQNAGSPAYSYAEITIGKRKEAVEFFVDAIKHYAGLDSRYSTSEVAKMVLGLLENLPDSKLEGDELTIRITIDDSGHVLISGLDITNFLELLKSTALSGVADSLQSPK